MKNFLTTARDKAVRKICVIEDNRGQTPPRTRPTTIIYNIDNRSVTINVGEQPNATNRLTANNQLNQIVRLALETGNES